MNFRIATIARYTLLEAARTRLVALVAMAVLALLAISLFVESIAIAEAARFQTGGYAAGVRIACVFITALYVLTSMAREQNDRVLDILLALDMPRSHYLLGKLGGFLAIATLIATAAAVPLFSLVPPQAASQWMVSLALELGVIVALALFCVITFNQLTAAACFVLAFYLLARALTAIRLIAENPITGGDTLSHHVMQLLVEGLALILPAIDGWTRTAWLVDGAARWADIVQIAGWAALYVTLLAAAAMFDFYRKEY